MATSLADRVVVILVEPLHPGNVGATARAMKNMGLDRLVLVDPPEFDPQRARWMAPGCDDLIARMRIVATLDEALDGVQVAVATTARHRRHGQPVLEPRQLAVEALDRDGVTAILFGREDHGLPASAVARCSALLRIPTPEHASLNLAQAVLLVCHDLFEEARARGDVATGRIVGGQRQKPTRSLQRREPPADIVAMESAVQDMLAVLDRVGYAATQDKVAITARGALQRAMPSRSELNALRGMLDRIAKALPQEP